MSSPDDILALYSPQLNALSTTFGGHQGVDRPSIIHWLSQFEREHIPLALRLLDYVNYYNNQNISALLGEVLELARANLQGVAHSRILYLVPGAPWEGDAFLARRLRYGGLVPQRQIVTPLDLSHLDPREWDAIIVLKDFAGTGMQLREWWVNIGEAIILPLELRVLFSILVCNHIAIARLLSRNLAVTSARELNEPQNIFHPSCVIFSADEKTIILDYCRKSGASEEYLKGYGENGLAVAFDYGCPNNSLPVLWHRGNGWIPLFKRHAI